MSDKAETMELKLHANRGEWVATVHTVRCTAPWLVKLGEKFYVRTSEPGESSFVYDHAERALSMTEVENAFDANLSVEVSRVEYAGTGVRTTGEVADAGFMPLAEDGAVFRCISAECGALAFKRELQRDGSCMCGASVHRLGGVPADQYRTLKATIAEQSAEIERLKGELHEAVARTRAECDKGYAALFGAHQQMVADRDTLRLEVQKLKDLSFEAQDRYAALEAERDELRTRTDHHTQTLVMLGEERERLIRHRKDERERAEKYLAVINAQADMIDAQERHAAVSLRLSVAYAAAGFVAEARVTADVPMMAKEADHE